MAAWPYSTVAWQSLRKRKLERDPLCEDCRLIDRVTEATCVDHKVPISAGGKPFPPLNELSSKCWPCHSRKTARGQEAGAIRSDKPEKGCRPDGSPLDPNHPWAA